MKITLDASIKEHREIAELFRGSKIGHSKAVFKRIGPTAYLLGVDHIKGGFWSDEFLDRSPFRANKIIIDLSTAKMDLRMALGTGIKFRAYTLDQDELPLELTGTLRSYDSKYNIELNSDYWVVCSDLISIEEDEIKLCPDYLKSVGVEVEE